MTKKPILLLHGALGAKDQLQRFFPVFEENGFTPINLSFQGHGGSTPPVSGYSMDAFIQDILSELENKAIKSIPIFGYSMGGFVSLLLASRFSGRIERLVTLGTKFNWNLETAKKETGMLDPDKIESKVPKFAQALQNRHGAENWKAVLKSTAQMMTQLGQMNPLTEEALGKVSMPVKILVGEEDQMVSVEESKKVASQISRAQFKVIPNLQHPIEKLSPEIIKAEILPFLTQKS